MSTAGNARAAGKPEIRPGDIVSRCGLLCNTCSAYITGVCPGCPNLETGECIIRDCADLKGTSCLDCQASSCYHFEAYVWRRREMRAKTKTYARLAGLGNRGSSSAGRGGCGGCGCGSKAGGCGGACATGCPAARLARALSEI